MGNIYKYLVVLLLVSCTTATEINLLSNKKFYKIHKNNKGEFILRKKYFENEMVNYKFNEGKLVDGTNIMEYSVYQIDNYEVKDSIYTINMHLIENPEIKEIFKIIDKIELGILEVIRNDYKTYYIDSLFLDKIKTIKIPPCNYNTPEYKMSKKEYNDCIQNYLKSEELRRIKEDDFSWYGKLDCKKYFNKETCEELAKEKEQITAKKLIKQKMVLPRMLWN